MRNSVVLKQSIGSLQGPLLRQLTRQDVQEWAKANGVPVAKALKSLDSFNASEPVPSHADVLFNGRPLDVHAWGSRADAESGDSAIPYADAPESEEPIDLEAAKRELAQISETALTDGAERTLSYNAARLFMFSKLDNRDGVVTCVYTGRELKTNEIPNGSDMNCEHTWPQSKGAKGAAKSDLHHLFITDSQANSRRGNHPFGNVEKVLWEKNECKLGLDSAGSLVFQPPENHKGNVKRALEHFSSRYNIPIPSAEAEAIAQWGDEDPVDAAEVTRNAAIKEVQGFGNEFIENAADAKTDNGDAVTQMAALRRKLHDAMDRSILARRSAEQGASQLSL